RAACDVSHLFVEADALPQFACAEHAFAKMCLASPGPPLTSHLGGDGPHPSPRPALPLPVPPAGPVLPKHHLITSSARASGGGGGERARGLSAWASNTREPEIGYSGRGGGPGASR